MGVNQRLPINRVIHFWRIKKVTDIENYFLSMSGEWCTYVPTIPYDLMKQLLHTENT